MADLKIAFELTMSNEGGYSKDPDDKGGETYKGISRFNFPNWIGWPLVDLAKKDKAFPDVLNKNSELQIKVVSFYETEFWNKLNLDKLTNQKLATELFDTAVNMGKGVAAQFIIRALNVLNKNGSLYPDIEVSVNINPAVVSFINSHKSPDLLYFICNTLQGARYIDLAEKSHTKEKYMYGWLKRCF